MLQALELSKNALPDCLPNPPVGCLILNNRNVVAQGYTQAPGEQHAEIVALNQLDKHKTDQDLTMIVTLEPCCFFGRTPPCTEQIINSGVKQIYVGMLDPHPKVNGQGIEQLNNAGLFVKSGFSQKEIFSFLSSYLHPH